MSPRQPIAQLATALLAWIGMCCHGFSADKPNLVFFLTDDLRYSDIACYGATKVKAQEIGLARSVSLLTF